MVKAWLAGIAASAFALLLAGTAQAHLERPSYWPDPRPDTSISPAAGGRVPVARSLASAVPAGASRRRSCAFVHGQARRLRRRQRSTRPRTEVRVVCQGSGGATSMRLARASIDQRSQPGLPAAAQPARHQALPQAGHRAARHQRAPAVQVPLQLRAEGGRRLGQQRPHRDHARHLHRAGVAPGAGERPALQPVAAPAGRERRQHAELRVPGHLPARPEPDLRPGPRRGGQAARAAAQQPAGDPAAGARPVRALQPADRGQRREARGRDPRRRHALPGQRPGGQAARLRQARRAAGRPHRRLRRPQHADARRPRARLLHRGERRRRCSTGRSSSGTPITGTWRSRATTSGCRTATAWVPATPRSTRAPLRRRGRRRTDFYPDAPRYNTTITKCDMRNSALGYSGSMGNAVRVTNNHIYGNATGISTDTLSSAGHPGYPADSQKVDHNFIYSNNFNVYQPDSPVKPLVAVPNGTGILYAGMNDARVHDNWFFDNWRDGAMLFAVPDAFTSAGGPEGDVFPGVSCTTQADRALGLLREPLLRQQDGPGAGGLPLPVDARPVRRASRRSRARRGCRTATTSGGTSGPATPGTAGSATPARMARPAA